MLDDGKKTIIHTELATKNNQLVVKKATITKEFSMIKKKWVKTGYDEEFLSLAEGRPELKKEAQIKVILKKEAVNTHTLEPMQAFFLTKVTAKIPENEKDVFLSVSDNQLFLHTMNTRLQTTQPLSIIDSKYCTIDKKQKRIEDAEALKLIESGVKAFTKLPSGEIRVQL